MPKLLAVLMGHLRGYGDARLDIVGVDMHDRDLKALCQVTRVEGRAAVFAALVVKPIWLFVIMWMVPPTL